MINPCFGISRIVDEWMLEVTRLYIELGAEFLVSTMNASNLTKRNDRQAD